MNIRNNISVRFIFLVVLTVVLLLLYKNYQRLNPNEDIIIELLPENESKISIQDEVIVVVTINSTSGYITEIIISLSSTLKNDSSVLLYESFTDKDQYDYYYNHSLGVLEKGKYIITVIVNTRNDSREIAHSFEISITELFDSIPSFEAMYVILTLITIKIFSKVKRRLHNDTNSTG